MSLQSRIAALITEIGADIKERVTLSSAQTVTGVKTFPPGALLMRNAGATQTAEPYSDVNAPETLMMTEYASAVSTPAAGKIVLYSPDGTALLWKDDTGTVRQFGGGSKTSELTAVSTPVGTTQFPVNEGGTSKRITLSQIDSYVGPVRNTSTAAQSLGTGDTYVTGSRIVFPQSRMKDGVVYRARIVVTKTAAGTASPVFTIRTGTAGTTADTSRLAYTGVAQTAVADTGYLEIQCVIRTHASLGSVSSWLRFDHDLASTGFANTTRGFQGHNGAAVLDTTAAGVGIGVSINAGASSAWTVQQCYAELVNLTN